MATVTAASISTSDSLERFRQEFNTLRSDVSNIQSGSLTITNEANNRILTSVSTNTFNAEESLTFDGTTFSVGGGAQTTLSGNLVIPNAGNIGSADDNDAIAIASNGVVTFSQAPVFPDGSIAVADLDIDGGTDIGAGLADADLFIVDDGAGGTNRKTAASRIKTYIADVTLTTAAQTNITSLGTLTTLTVDNIIINGTNIGHTSDTDAIAIASDGTVTFSSDVTFTGASYNAVWDKSDNALEFADNAIAAFGAGSDLRIYHTGSNSYIDESGTGALIFKSNIYSFRNAADNETIALFTENGSVDLYYDNSKKLETTSSGIDVTGEVQGDSLDIDGNADIAGTLSLDDTLTVVRTDGIPSVNVNGIKSDNGYQPSQLNLNRYGASTGTATPDSSTIGDIRWSGLDSAGTPAYAMFANITASIGANASGGAPTTLTFGVGNTGSTAAEKFRIMSGSTVVNELSTDYDFRVESNGNTHMLFVDGGNDNVHIGSSAVTSQSVPLQVGTGQANQIVVKGSGSGFTQGGIIIESGTDNTPGSRGQGVYYFNEGNDRTYYAGTLYNNGTVWGVGSTTGTSLATAAANTTNATFSVDSVNGRVGVGTATPSQKLTVNGSDARIYLTGAGTNIDMDSSANGQLHLDGNGYDFAIALNATAANLYTNSSSRSIIFGTDETERMRVANDGVRIGTTSHIFNSASNEALSVKNASTGNALTLQSTDVTGGFPILYLSSTDSASSQNAVVFQRTGGTVGTITTTASATAYNTSSDYRLKENVTALTGAIDRVKTLSPKRFNFIVEPDKTVDGFLAHEVTTVPEAIVGTKDQVDDDDNPVYQGIDQSKLVPLLTAALQEAVAKIESLETRIAALET